MVSGKYMSAGFFLLLSFSLLSLVRADAVNSLSYDGRQSFYAKERALFLSARKALNQGDMKAFTAQQSKLASYPIADYLEFEKTRNLIKTSNLEQGKELIKSFRSKSRDMSLVGRLGQSLLSSLARQKYWESYYKLAEEKRYTGNKCDYLLARVNVRSGKDGFDQLARSLWEQPRKHPGNCQIAFELLEKKSTPSIASIWTRIHALMERGRVAEVKAMFAYLSSNDKRPLEIWAKYYASPEKILGKKGAFAKDNEANRRIVLSLVKRWSKRDSLSAYEYWRRVREHYSVSRQQRFDVDKLIARMAAFDRVPEAHQWLQDLPESAVDKTIRFWRIRAALYNLDWPAVIDGVEALQSKEREDGQWRYWLARAQEMLGNTESALLLYESLSQELSYHGFLAADRLGKPYSIRNTVEVNDKLKRDLAEAPELIRAREFEYAGIAWEGRREWMNEVADFSEEQRYAAAALALEWSWADRSLYTVAKTGNKEAINLRFPTLYKADVQAAAALENIDSAWIYGVMRRESGFVADIKSGAGAVGLMQLMPSTAKDVARRKGRARSGNLTNSSNNISLGSSYLRYVLTIFSENQVLATAAYNAGPSRVKRWLPTERSTPVDVWVDTIPYKETRRYVRAVTAYTAIFEKQLNGRVTPIGQRLGKDIVPELLVSKR